MTLISPNAPHGTLSGYINWGCRCSECRRANTEAKRTWREIRMKERVESEEESKTDE